jgi:hypothetical protein
MSLDFIKSILSEPDGTGSTTRVLMAVIVFFTIGAGIFLCGALHSKHITVEQLNSYLTTGGQFVVTTTGPLYLINKGASVMGKNGQNSNTSNPNGGQ